MSGAESYIVEAGSATGLSNLATLNTGTATSLTTAAPPGIYYVRVRGVYGCGGAGNASNEVIVTVAGATVPGAPALNPPVVTGSTVTVSWTAGGGGTASGYTLTAASTPDGAPIATVPLTGTSASFANVPSGTDYFAAHRVECCGTSAPSPQVTVTVP